MNKGAYKRAARDRLCLSKTHRFACTILLINRRGVCENIYYTRKGSGHHEAYQFHRKLIIKLRHATLLRPVAAAGRCMDLYFSKR